MTKRREFGGIRKLPSTRFQAYYLTPGGTKITAPAAFPSKAQAEVWLAERRREIDADRFDDASGSPSRPTPTIPDGTVWAIAADKVFTVLRQDLSVQANPYSAFSSDSTQIRGVMRANFGFVQPDCVVQIVSGGS